jgi:hypothetical protein
MRTERRPTATSRRALELLAASPDGATEALLVAHGFTIDLLVELVRAGLATARTERVVVGGRAMEIARVRITEAAASAREKSAHLALGTKGGRDGPG